MNKQRGVSILVVLVVFAVMFMGLLGVVSSVSARWYVRDSFENYNERICRNGMIFAGMWPRGVEDQDHVSWFDWDIDPYGNPWYEKDLYYYTDTFDMAMTLPITSVVSGPTVSDPIQGVEFVSNFWIVRWEDLYPGRPVGEEVPVEEQAYVAMYFRTGPDVEWGDAGTNGDAAGCIIDPLLPAPSMYEYCNTSESGPEASPQVSFPADIVVADLDVSMYVTNTLSQTISAQLTSPDGSNISLFTDLLPDEDTIEPTFDDETTEIIYSSGYYRSEFLPDDSLTAFDGAPAIGDWELSLTDAQGQQSPVELVSWCLIASGYRTVRFAAAEFETDENAGTADIMVELSEPSTVTTTVDYTTLPGGGSNQEPISGRLTFAPGEQSKTLAVPITDDTVVEADEAVQLTLSNPGNQYGLGEPMQASLIILDNDPELLFIYLPSFGTGGSAPVADVIDNPGFESGPVDWFEYSWLGYPLIFHADDLPVPPNSGSWATWLGGDDFEISYVEQTVTVPTTEPFLSYWHYISSPDYCGYDFGGVIVDELTVVEVYDLCQATNTEGWVQRTVDLSAYSGQTIALQLRAETDGSLVSNLFVDDVSFQASNAGIGPDENTDLEGPQPATVEKSSLRASADAGPTPPDVQRLLRDAARAR